MSTSKGTSLIDQNDLLKTKWGGDTLKYDINSAVNSFAKNFEEYNAEGTLQQRKDELNALYGGNILNYKSGSDVYTDYKRDLDQINAFDSAASALQQQKDAAAQAELQKTQYVDTRRQLMQKYLPETLLAQGIANTGYTADALLKAENNYNQYVLGAMNERAATEQNALKEYQDALSAYKMQRADAEYEDFLAKEEKSVADAEAKEVEKATLMTSTLSWVNAGLSKDEVKAFRDYYLSALNLTDEEKAALTAESDAFVDKIYTEADTGTNSGTNSGVTSTDSDSLEEISKRLPTRNSNSIVGSVLLGKNYTPTFDGTAKDKFIAVVDGEQYSVKSGNKVSKDSAKDANFYKAVQQAIDKKQLGDGDVFVFDDKVYIVSSKVNHLSKFSL